jgi:phage repressor protein C with HTH and peptisase S24 domain
MEPLGTKLRQQRRSLNMTLDELAARSQISKPYLSLIETGRVPNPPSDEKLRRLEQSLGFTDGELVSHAHLHRTPLAVREMLAQLLQKSTGLPISDDQQVTRLVEQLTDGAEKLLPGSDDTRIPIINTASAGYPRGFNDLSFSRSIAVGFITLPDVNDKDAFAVRVAGDHMTPRYQPGDTVIFSPAARVRSGDDCFVCFKDGDTAFKRIFFEKDEKSKPVLRLQPRNEKYRPRIIPVGKVTGTYRAVYRLNALESTGE